MKENPNDKHLNRQQSLQNLRLQSPVSIGQNEGSRQYHNNSSIISNKKISQVTLSSLEEFNSSQCSQPSSPAISSFSNQRWADQEYIRVDNLIIGNSIQNYPSAQNSLVQFYLYTSLDSHSHNQYQMQNQPLKRFSAQEDLSHSQGCRQNKYKLTPNTQASSSPQINHDYQPPYSSSMVPYLTSNCEFKNQQKKQTSGQSHDILLDKQRSVLVIEPRKQIYYKNRVQIIQWLKIQCVKLELSRETFANVIFLMDNYFKNSDFDSNEFLEIALSMLVIASKMNQSKVLFTTRVADNNGISQQKMLNRQIQILSWFKFRTDTYNFARIVGEYIKRWDQYVKQNNKHFPVFISETFQSFILHQKLFYLCENQLKINRELSKSTIQIIFKELICSINPEQEQISSIIHSIFKEDNIFTKNKDQYVFQYPFNNYETYESYNVIIRSTFHTWMYQFDRVKLSQLTQKFKLFNNKGICHNIYLALQL